MKLTLEQYHSMIKTRSIGFIGVGVSHRELIRQYAAAGARLTVRDRRSLEELGDFGRELTQMGVRLMLGAITSGTSPRRCSSAPRHEVLYP